MKTKIISAFPGVGKTHFFNKNTELDILDSDSSKFDKKYFPDNYIEHIKNNSGKVDIILVSSHKVVRDALVKNNIDFILVYPDKSLKSEYIKRFKNRGNENSFIDLISNNWINWLEELDNQECLCRISLNHERLFLNDAVKHILGEYDMTKDHPTIKMLNNYYEENK